MDDLQLAGARRRSRRLQPVRHRHAPGARPDVRNTVRRSVRAGGEAVVPSRRGPSERPRNLVLLLDVSGSMDPYARALVRFAHAAVARAARGRVEAFALGTRLTRLTRALSSRDPDEAMAAAADAAIDWSGGTRLGDGLARRSTTSGVSGGGPRRGRRHPERRLGSWRSGELAEQMARLHRVARRIVWVNPLKASEGYAPLARGMAAALPYVDDFVEGHSLAALEELAAVVARRMIYERLAEALRLGQPIALVTVIEGPHRGAKLLVEEDGSSLGRSRRRRPRPRGRPRHGGRARRRHQRRSPLRRTGTGA